MNADPRRPGLGFSEDDLRNPPANPSWNHHIRGGTVTRVQQAGLDRVLILELEKRSEYGKDPCLIYFEMTGRNANIILTSKPEGRVIACSRRVGSNQSRYRTITPGTIYVPPPSSGLPPDQWHSLDLPPGPEPADLFRRLEGVGPLAARAILKRSGETGEGVNRILTALAEDLQDERVPDWIGPPGPEEEPAEHRPPARERELQARLERERREISRKLRASEEALEGLNDPETFRTWGNLILTGKNSLTRGMERALLADYEGTLREIPLKAGLNPAENAARYFRKAGGVHREQDRLQSRIRKIRDRLTEIDRIITRIPELSQEEVAELLAAPRRETSTRRPRQYILAGGWRCLVGRNARENAELTFRKASGDDFWLHARGTPGGHVILKRDGRPDNPPEAVLQQAADIAARHSGRKGILPVDWTLAKYVRRVKGAPPGFVTYTREKTLFGSSD